MERGRKMTKAQLIKALEKLDDNAQVYFSQEGMNTLFCVDEVKESSIHGLYLNCEDSPRFEDLQSICEYLLDNEQMPEEWTDALCKVVDLPTPFWDISERVEE